jgi:hypothetical protein
MTSDRFFREHTPFGAYVIATLNARTGQIIRIGIYSESQPTQNLHDEVLLHGPSANGRSFAEAQENVRRILATLPNWAHLRERIHGFKSSMTGTVVSTKGPIR